jgi:glycosyltransferase involved in cell wall biosynthesis
LIAARAAASADRVIAGNDVVAEWASGLCADVRVIPTCVEPSEYQPRSSWELAEPPVIGWIGSPATEPYLEEIATSLAEVVRSSGARLEIISGPEPTSSALRPFSARTLWNEQATRRVGRWDIGIMPLADGVYERAKCGYKLLQYAASGVPVVASPVGVNREMLTAMDGLAATTADEWVDALTQLLSESAVRRARRAAQGFEVADRYSYDAWESSWLDAVGW